MRKVFTANRLDLSLSVQLWQPLVFPFRATIAIKALKLWDSPHLIFNWAECRSVANIPAFTVWCEDNCYATPSYCPDTICTCSEYASSGRSTWRKNLNLIIFYNELLRNVISNRSNILFTKTCLISACSSFLDIPTLNDWCASSCPNVCPDEVCICPCKFLWPTYQ